MLNDLYFKTTSNIRPHFLGPMGGLKIEGPLYRTVMNIHTVELLMQNTRLSAGGGQYFHKCPSVLRPPSI